MILDAPPLLQVSFFGVALHGSKGRLLLEFCEGARSISRAVGCRQTLVVLPMAAGLPCGVQAASIAPAQKLEHNIQPLLPCLLPQDETCAACWT